MFTDCYCTQFRRAAQAITKIYDEALDGDQILLTQFSLLRALKRLGPATQNELAKEVALDKTTISRNVKVLVQRGWIDVEATEDLREKRLTLSDLGQAKLESSSVAWKKAQDSVLKLVQTTFQHSDDDPLIETLEVLQTLAVAGRKG